MNFDLKDLRERKGLSQAELASAMNEKWKIIHPDESNRFNSDMIIRMEKDPARISLEALMIIVQVFGVTLDQLLRPEISRLPTPQPTDNWGRITRIRSKVNQAIESIDNEALNIEQKKAIAELQDKLRMLSRKAKIACIGRPDSGKSRTLNTLIGKDILPTNWTPTTSAFVLLKHMDDKPDFWGMDTVKVFRDVQQTEGSAWDPDCFADEDYCNKWCLASGSYELIESYGSHDGDAEEEEAGAIVVFVNSAILKNCDFIDLPGFHPESAEDEDDADRDSKLSAQASAMADAFIYLSIANSFLYGDDLAMAQLVLKNMPMLDMAEAPLNNLFIVATHAFAVDHGDEEKLKLIRNKAAQRLWSLVEGHPNFENYATPEVIENRMYTSEMDSWDLTKAFYSDLQHFTEQLPLVQEEKLLEVLKQFCEAEEVYFRNIEREYQDILSQHTKMQQQLDALEQNEDARAELFRNRIYTVTDIINGMERECRDQTVRIYHQTIDPKHIVDVIDRHGLKKNQKDLQHLITLLNSEIENKLTAELANHSKKLEPAIDEFLTQCQVTFTKVRTQTPQADSTPLIAFDVGRAFAGGLTGVATFGALSAWAASLGNLGGYIIVTKAVSLLASLGIHIGGTAAAVSAVSAIGGPIVLGATIAVIATLTSILALGGTWKKLIGNRLVKQYQEKGVLDNLIRVSDQFWKDTTTAFRTGVEQIDREWKAKIRDFKRKIAEQDPEVLNQEIRSAHTISDFFSSLHDNLSSNADAVE